jgi:ABC-type Fe3+/spermidine/putrescine transport system ATPase subunit
MSLIEVKGLTKNYGDLQAVRGLDLQIEQGEKFSKVSEYGIQDL